MYDNKRVQRCLKQHRIAVRKKNDWQLMEARMEVKYVDKGIRTEYFSGDQQFTINFIEVSYMKKGMMGGCYVWSCSEDRKV